MADWPPDVAEELAPILQGVEGLRAAAENHKSPKPLAPSDAAVSAAAKGHDQAMEELAALGFHSLGDAGERLADGTQVVTRWFAHADGTICGWLGFLQTKTGPRLLAFLMTEASNSSFCTSLRGGSGLSLARPPHQSHADFGTSASMADMVRHHRERVRTMAAEGTRSTVVTTIEEAIALLDRSHRARMKWRASSDETDLLHADLRSVLASSYRSMGADAFQLVYGQAAEWLGFQPPAAAPLGAFATDPSPLTDFLAATLTGPEAHEGAAGVESDWLFHWQVDIQGERLQILDVAMAGNEDEGVSVAVAPGVYVVEARVMTYGIDRRISRVRVFANGLSGVPGEQAGEVSVDLAAVAICDVDRLHAWAQANEEDWQRWVEGLAYKHTASAGAYTCEPAGTIVPFLDTGFGDGTYPVFPLMRDGRVVGLEAVFLAPGTPYF